MIGRKANDLKLSSVNSVSVDVCVCVCACARTLSCSVSSVVPNSLGPCTIVCQAPLSMELSRQEYWSGLSFPSPRYLPDSGVEPGSPALQADSLPFEPLGKLYLGDDEI